MELLKKQNYYFNSFSELAEYSIKISEEMKKTLEKYEETDLVEELKIMHEIEHEADLRKHKLLKKLTDEFIAPIEREDIVNLAHELDDVTDMIESIFQKLYMYNVKTLREDTLQFSEIILKLTEALKIMLDEFPNFKKPANLKKLIVEISNLEEEGDRFYIKAMRKLYSESNDPVHIMVWTNIYDTLERCCDSVEHVADAVETIIMKNT